MAQIALAYVLRQREINALAVCTSSSAQRIRSNAEALKVELSAEEAEWLDLGR